MTVSGAVCFAGAAPVAAPPPAAEGDIIEPAFVGAALELIGPLDGDCDHAARATAIARIDISAVSPRPTYSHSRRMFEEDGEGW